MSRPSPDDPIAFARYLREQIYAQIGVLEPEPLTDVLSPYPEWPTERKWVRIIHLPASTILLTEGLSDPFADKAKDPESEYNGYGMELFVEVAGKYKASELRDSLPMRMLEQVSMAAAAHMEFKGMVEQFGTMALGMYGKELVPDQYLDEQGILGLLLGTPSPAVPEFISLNREAALLVSVKILKPSDFLAAGAKHTGANFRRNLLKDYAETGKHAVTAWPKAEKG